MAVAAPDIAQERSAWSHHYWLCHCEGYRVDTPEGHLGFVEEVVCAADGDEPVALRVRVGFEPPRVVVVPIDEVREISPTGERVLVEQSP